MMSLPSVLPAVGLIRSGLVTQTVVLLPLGLTVLASADMDTEQRIVLFVVHLGHCSALPVPVCIVSCVAAHSGLADCSDQSCCCLQVFLYCIRKGNVPSVFVSVL
eukprot:TRINITY_DN1577_c0_g1_i1.p2 TRINITY_DN1577_c0_g1~~TRINITY_DN1577_c0_g1_i1.p2  ORF type:complete len:105 (+),score=2.65 TRINITY_DN1577_c0_g1_i1:533-847(+)